MIPTTLFGFAQDHRLFRATVNFGESGQPLPLFAQGPWLLISLSGCQGRLRSTIPLLDLGWPLITISFHAAVHFPRLARRDALIPGELRRTYAASQSLTLSNTSRTLTFSRAFINLASTTPTLPSSRRDSLSLPALTPRRLAPSQTFTPVDLALNKNFSLRSSTSAPFSEAGRVPLSPSCTFLSPVFGSIVRKNCCRRGRE